MARRWFVASAVGAALVLGGCGGQDGGGPPRVTGLDRRVLERWADFDARVGILARRPNVARAFAFDVGRARSG
jgi:hypothetical protein